MGGLYSSLFGEAETTDERTHQEQNSSPAPAITSLNQAEASGSLNRDHLQIPQQNTHSFNETTETAEVDKLNLIVLHAGKTLDVDMFPLETISLLLNQACDWARKKPEKMTLVYEGDLLDVKKTINQYPKLRGGSKVNLIQAC